MISNRERVGRALDLLKDGLYPFVEREMRSAYSDKWLVAATPFVSEDRTLRRSVEQILKQDISELLKLMSNQWREVFKKTLGNAERSLVGELISTRNSWAHNDPFSTDDAYRALDSVSRLLTAISAPEADEVDKQKQELLRVRFAEQARRETRRAHLQPLEGNPTGGLKPWREIVTPHQDVASGRYQEAEFAADLWQVYLDEGSDEYRVPTEFFRRTYLTEGLKQLLTNALLRLSGKGGDPVIELQTNFGGGKTHAMLALYHLFMGVPASQLPGLEPVLSAAGVMPPAKVNTAVLVGNKISPGQPQRKKDGTVVRTLWGELAWQLGGKEGYEMLRQADETSTNPGDTLRLLFNRYAPCLILIDEWVAYARQLHQENDLPGGSFDTHFTFAQTLSESAKNANQTLLVASIPASDNEIGGDQGLAALDRLKNAIGRVESPWRPASADESFEIVRRRLFQPIAEQTAFVARDAVVRAFGEMYQAQSQEFPSECREASYKRRLENAYPIHPELFDRLYTDWSSLDKFQRTRGVLRLMAKVIHTLWEGQDKSLLIMPANVPMDDGQVQAELTRYLEDHWVPVIEKDVDGDNSLPLECDRQNPNLGRYSACRRVARTIYLGSAPTLRAANRGLEDRRIKLGCVQPGESVATFGDALRRLTDRATHLYVDGSRYWFSTQPSVTRLAQDRAEQQERDKVWDEIIRRLRADKQRGEFAGVHIAPDSSADVPDEMAVRLVVLGAQYPHKNKETDTPARVRAEEILQHKGASPRYCKNMLLFLAPDKAKLELLEKSVCQYLAWDSIVREKEALELGVFQSNQATTKQQETDKIVKNLIQEAYIWLLVPTQPDPHAAIEWQEIRLHASDSPIVQASRKATHEEHLMANYAASRLGLEALDPYLWRDVNHLDLKKLWKYLAYYLYLPRLRDEKVLLAAVETGVAELLWNENFAYATGWDESKGRYLGLTAGKHINASLSSQCLIVKPEIAQRQFEADRAAIATTQIPQPNDLESGEQRNKGVEGQTSREVEEKTGTYDPSSVTTPAPTVLPKRFYGSIKLDALRLRRDAGLIADEVIQHFASLVGAEVEITLEVQASIPNGVPDNVARAVTENCRVLKFTTQEFEHE
ncbi:Swt1 family HEPN domain-containing protein [Chroococcidiopsis sp. CCNUC1]|uniref:Swt1 family HEPN domain-containing protein n=1 Tax=Chroococcidiopsis sp. CCNUC1 TaxID=2653189 RepID=UPI0020224154|nr:Swt1 family HEPN domain-containing protein [Chroococcidiopsis sp. CCNUC1]URD48439.1 Swt1 family HEPN domain-containing protein [Chroococcidiopsis sp. CCNUC1]